MKASNQLRACMLRCSVVANHFVTPRTVACQAPMSIGFPRQEYFSGLPFPSSVGLSKPGKGSMSLALQADSLPLIHLGSPSIVYKL